MRVLILILAIFSLSSIITKTVGARSENMEKLERYSQIENWKEIWSDGFEILLIRLPDYVAEKKLYEIKDRKGSNLTISHREMSSDNTKIAFTVGNFGSPSLRDELFIIDTDKQVLKKVGYSSSDLINLIGFIGNNRLLLEGQLKVDNDGMLIHEKPVGDSSYLYVFNLDNKNLEVLSSLGTTTVGMGNSKCSGSVLAYATSNGIVTYNVDTKKENRINKKGNLVALSPNGNEILLENNEGYFLVDNDGGNGDLILPRDKAKKFKPFGGYWELFFWSWSPDGNYILFTESSDQNKGKKFLLNLYTKELKNL